MGICLIALFCCPITTNAHYTDTIPSDKLKKKDSSSPNETFFLLGKKGLLGRLAKSIVSDTSTPVNIVRLDILYQSYKGRIIRNIEVRSVDFGVPINDTSKSFKNTLTNWASALHKTTRENVVRKNLFFKQYDKLLPILLADNERHLRDQRFLNDAKFIVKPVLGTRDSVDVIVLTKDVLSIGGRFRMSSLTKFEAGVTEDNIAGSGNEVLVGGYYDKDRRKQVAHSAQYIGRNFASSFADLTVGYRDYADAFNNFLKQETTVYTRFVRPLVNPYMKWTYAFEAATHRTSNMYLPDSLYYWDFRYRYYNVDAWVGWNMTAKSFSGGSSTDDRLRTLVGLRFLHQQFQEVPKKFEQNYFYQYANITGVLGSIAIFRQDFYKTNYIYGFGVTEDVPEGLDFSVTTGWTNKERRVRPYMGLDMSFNYFTRRENYFNYTLRLSTYNYERKYEDISVLANLEFFSKLRPMGKKWKQRTFITGGLTTQWNKVLNEPLFLESEFGLPEYTNIFLGGDHRLTVKAESVFFSPWNFLSFKFAPFVFANGTLLTPEKAALFRTNLYGTIGGGVRTRNESLVFGTLELKAFYFPGRNFNGDAFRVEFNTSIKFKYNRQLIRRPQFAVLN